MLSRREALEIVDFVVKELNKRLYPSMTDGRLDLTKTSVGVVSGTADYGGNIADGAIFNRQVNSGADILGTKIRVASTSERGTVELAEYGETTSGLAIQASDISVVRSDMLGGYVLVANIDDTPVSGEINAPISSNWAYEHITSDDPHVVYLLKSSFDGLTKITVGTNEPVAPTSGDLWIDTN